MKVDTKVDANFPEVENIRRIFGIEDTIVMYVGNLESYQGVDLLLESFSILINKKMIRASLVIIGGKRESILKYSDIASSLNISDSVYLIGPRPFEALSRYLLQADILVSPRLKGVNTPMKLFSYLNSGKPTLVTDLVTHTQVVDQSTAFLVNPNPEDVSEGLATLLGNQDLCRKLGAAGKQLIENNYSYDAFIKKFDSAMSWLEGELQNRSSR